MKKTPTERGLFYCYIFSKKRLWCLEGNFPQRQGRTETKKHPVHNERYSLYRAVGVSLFPFRLFSWVKVFRDDSVVFFNNRPYTFAAVVNHSDLIVSVAKVSRIRKMMSVRPSCLLCIIEHLRPKRYRRHIEFFPILLNVTHPKQRKESWFQEHRTGLSPEHKFLPILVQTVE